MLGLWLNDMESLEAICQDDEAKRIFLRMAAMSRDGNMGNFLSELARDEDLDDETKGTLKELAEDNTFLLAVEDYLSRTKSSTNSRATTASNREQEPVGSHHGREAAGLPTAQMGDRGLEPRTSALSERRSNQLS